MAVTAATIKARWASDFDALADAALEAAITEAALQMSEDAWGDLYDTGHALLAAHIALQDAGGSGAAPGPVTSEKVLGDSVAYAVRTPTNDDDADLLSTFYGRRFVRLRSQLFVSRVA